MNSLFFDSEVTFDEYGTPVYDRPNNAEQLRETFASFLSNGIVPTRKNNMAAELGFMVSQKSGMQVTVHSGMCWINGACGWSKTDMELTLDSGGDYDRRDLIVLRLDLRRDARNIDVFVRKGSVGTDPVAPVLQRDTAVHELCLAEIFIPAHSSVIMNANISDTRMNTDLCGFVAGILTKIDTEPLYRQIQSDLLSFRETEQADFLEWYDGIKNILDESTANNLLTLIKERIEKSALGVPGGVATLDANGKLAQMPTVNDIGIGNIFLAVYPVGSIYITTSAANPGILFGGVWRAFAPGRVLVGINPSDSDFSTSGKMGGSKTHTLTVDETPKHVHTQSLHWSAQEGNSSVVSPALETNDPREYSTYPTTGETGGGQPHNNLQPYITCYMWRRSA